MRRSLFLKNYNALDFEFKKIQRVKFWIKIFSSVLILTSNPVPLRLLFKSFSSTWQCAIRAHIFFVNSIIAYATVQKILLALIFARTLTFDFTMVSHYFLCTGLEYQKLAATSKFSDIGFETAFISHMST